MYLYQICISVYACWHRGSWNTNPTRKENACISQNHRKTQPSSILATPIFFLFPSQNFKYEMLSFQFLIPHLSSVIFFSCTTSVVHFNLPFFFFSVRCRVSKAHSIFHYASQWSWLFVVALNHPLLTRDKHAVKWLFFTFDAL